MSRLRKDGLKLRKMRQNNKIHLRSLDLRGIPFTWQETKMFQKLRKHYNGQKLTTAIAFYTTMTELASIEGKGQGRHINCFKAYLQTIADRCGKSVSTIKRYLKEFRKLKIISWENRRKGDMNLSNKWMLLAYRQNINEPSSVHNNEPVIRKFIKRNFINNKRNYKNYKNYKNNKLTPIADIINRKRKQFPELRGVGGLQDQN